MSELLHAEIYKAGFFFSLVYMQTGNQFFPFCVLTKLILVIAYVWNNYVDDQLRFSSFAIVSLFSQFGRKCWT